MAEEKSVEQKKAEREARAKERLQNQLKLLSVADRLGDDNDRAELLEKLEFEVVEQAGRMIKAVVRSEIDKTSEPGPEVEKYKVPSIQDVFTVPSMEAPKVGAGDTATIDTTKANTDTSGSSADSGKIKETKK